MILDIQNISLSFGTYEVIKDASFHIEAHEKAALVGINGAGKSTLLKIIMKELQPDAGAVVLSKDVTVGYLAQKQEIDETASIYDYLLSVKQSVIELEVSLRASEHNMKTMTGDALTAEMNKYARMSEAFERAGGYALRSEASGVLKGLGFQEEDFSKQAAVLSGGQKTRVALGRLLLLAPDLILLDEPTNHLDLNSILWLETYLSNYKGAVLIVSHDRYFLNRIVSKVIEIDHACVSVYAGTYDDYSKKSAERYQAQTALWMKAEKEKKHQEAVIQKLQSFNREKSIKRAESRKKVLAKMVMPEKPVSDSSKMQFHVKPRFESGNDVLTVNGLTKAFGDQLLFHEISFQIFKGERIALIGANGTGKSTILKIINHVISPDAGEVIYGAHTGVGYYDQEMQQLHMEKTIFEEISDDYTTLTNTQIRSTLAVFLFTGEAVFSKISDLSGGECARVSLAKLMLSEANFLILDEPTNHLDIQSKEILENALRGYEGTVLCVSHDRYFINRTATRILELKEKSLASFNGNYDDYLLETEKLKESKKSPDETLTGNQPDTSVQASKQEWLTEKAKISRERKRKSDIEKVEKTISDLENEQSDIDRQFLDPEVSCDAQKCMSYSARRDELSSLIEQAYTLWNNLMEDDS